MPSKSKRNRRAAAQRPLSQSRGETGGTVAPSNENRATITRVQSEKAATSSSTSKGAALASAISAYFLRDLKWTGIVTGIIIILLIASYLVFH
jgi:hypothetical protein